MSMSLDCYCALCSGPFVACRVRGQGDIDNTQDIFRDGNNESYDPELVSNESLRWLIDTIRYLGYNPDARDSAMAYMSGPCPLFGPSRFTTNPSRPHDDPSR